MQKLLGVFTLLLSVFIIAACDLDADEFQIDLQSDLEAAELTISPDNIVDSETEVTISASQVDGYAFVEWREVGSGETFSESREFSFTPEIDLTLEAVYEESDPDDTLHSLLLSSEVTAADLSISPSDSVEDGAEVTIEASVVDGYEFVHWYDDENDSVFSEERVHTFTVDRDYNLIAVYDGEPSLEEQAADDTVAAFEGNLSHLQTMMDTIEQDDAQTMQFNLHGEFYNPELDTYETLNFTLNKTVVDNTVSTLHHIHIDIETPDETIDFVLYVNETDYYYEFYLDVSLFLDMMEGEDDVDFREIFVIEDHITFVLPKESGENAMVDELFTTIETEFGVSRTMIMGMIDDIDRFEPFFTLDYWNTQDHLFVEIDKVDDTNVETTIIVNSDLLHDIFEDVVYEIYHFIEPLDTDNELPLYEDFVDSPQYQEILGMIGFMQDFPIAITHEPYTSDAMSMHVDLTEMMPDFDQNGDNEFDDIAAFDFTMTYEAGGTIDIPEDSRNIFALADEFLQIALLIEAQSYANAVYDAALDNNTYTLLELNNMGIVYSLPVMDESMSEITVSDDGIELDFIFTTNKEPAFTQPLDRDTLNTLDPDGTPPQTREDFLDLIAYIDESNIEQFEIMTLLLEGLMAEQPVTNPLPEQDLEGQDYEHLNRYAGAVIIDYTQDSDGYQILYGAETTVESAYQYYKDFFDADASWSILDDVPNERLQAMHPTHDVVVYINFMHDSPYDNTILIATFIDENVSE